MSVSVIPGAISKADFEAKHEKGEGKKIVCYCTIGYRSGLYVKELQKKGVDNAHNLAGSILAWTHVDGTTLVDSAGKPTKELHTYGRRWALAPATYRCKWYTALGWT